MDQLMEKLMAQDQAQKEMKKVIKIKNRSARTADKSSRRKVRVRKNNEKLDAERPDRLDGHFNRSSAGLRSQKSSRAAN